MRIPVCLCIALEMGMMGLSLGASPFPEKTVTDTNDIVCDPVAIPVLTEAYYLHQPNSHLCGTNCTSPEYPDRCFMVPVGMDPPRSHPAGQRCYERFSPRTIQQLYEALDKNGPEQSDIHLTGTSGKSAVSDNSVGQNQRDGDAVSLNVRGTERYLERQFRVIYRCIEGKSPRVINPCQSDDNEITDEDYKEEAGGASSILVTSSPADGSSSSSAPQSCQKLCHLQILKGENHKIEFVSLLKEGAKEGGISLAFRIITNMGSETDWEPVSTSYRTIKSYRSGIIEDIQIRFRISDMSQVARLWVHRLDQGKETNIKLTCDDDKGAISTATPKLTRHPQSSRTGHTPRSTTGHAPTTLSSSQPGSESEEGNRVLPYALGISAVVFVAVGVGVGFYIYIRKRRSAEAQQDAQPSTVQTLQSDEVTLHDDVKAGSSRSKHATMGDNSLAHVPNESGSGTDDGEYGRLDRSGRRNESGAIADHSDVYNHVASPQPLRHSVSLRHSKKRTCTIGCDGIPRDKSSWTTCMIQLECNTTNSHSALTAVRRFTVSWSTVTPSTVSNGCSTVVQYLEQRCQGNSTLDINALINPRRSVSKH